MFELLVQLKLRRQAFIRRRLPRNESGSDHSYFAIASLIFFLSLPLIVCPPVALVEAPPAAVVIAVLVVLGFILCATIVLAPIGLILF